MVVQLLFVPLLIAVKLGNVGTISIKVAVSPLMLMSG